MLQLFPANQRHPCVRPLPPRVPFVRPLAELLRLKRVKQNRSLIIVCLTNTGEAAAKISKYRPPCPVVVVSTSELVLRQCSVSFGLVPLKASQCAQRVWCMRTDSVLAFLRKKKCGSVTQCPVSVSLDPRVQLQVPPNMRRTGNVCTWEGGWSGFWSVTWMRCAKAGGAGW